MSETRPPTAGERELAYLGKCIAHLYAGDNELTAAIAKVLQTFLDDYETEDDVPECPNCGEGCGGGHGLQTYHVRCGDLVQICDCLRPYLALARRATDGVTDWAATARDLISGDQARIDQHLLDLGDGGRNLVYCASCNTLAMPPHACATTAEQP
jgi:hypothetical protein